MTLLSFLIGLSLSDLKELCNLRKLKQERGLTGDEGYRWVGSES